METFASRSQLWPAARISFIAALLLFVITIVVGILNGLDLYEPDHDTLITHVHAGTRCQWSSDRNRRGHGRWTWQLAVSSRYVRDYDHSEE